MRPLILCAMLAISCASELGQEQQTGAESYWQRSGPFYTIDRAVPLPHQACSRVVVEFRPAVDVGAGCLVYGAVYSCLSNSEAMYYDGDYVIEAVEAVDASLGKPCALCGGSSEQILSQGTDELFIVYD